MPPDFLVIGAGVAGMRAAIELAAAGRVLVVAKETLRESSSEYAQGGIAVALAKDDSPELHARDTLYAGDGLCNEAAVRVLVEEGRTAVERLIEWGARFDRDEGGALAFTREGAHSRNRVLHAHGDSTGREISATLYRHAAAMANIEFRSYAATFDLLMDEGAVTGALVYDARAGGPVPMYARAVLLATGGLGRVFLNTTNPDVATGDGVAMAFRAGARVADLEFVQFHPTALHSPGAPCFLLSEALRGEGGVLRNAQGEPFMERYHAMRDLAPRDVVSRAIVSEMRHTGAPHVLLDLTHLDGAFLRGRFPRIFETCLRHGFDLTRQRVPVAPAAHYAMGGVWTDLDGRTSLPGLFAAGEVACTGVHGANRLASNSLLEGIVFGARAGRAMRDAAGPLRAAGQAPAGFPVPLASEEEVRRIAWEHCGVVRSGQGLQAAIQALEARATGAAPPRSPEDAELRNMHQVALLIARAALARRESRGAHFREEVTSSA